MKRVKKDAASFLKIGAAKMSNVKGGGWVEVTDSEGKVTRIWV